MYKLLFSKQALKDARNIKAANLAAKCELLLQILRKDPFTKTPQYEKLVGDLSGLYSRRINIQHRLVYEVNQPEQEVIILMMWTHYQ